MPTLVPPPEYKIIINFYLIVTGANTNKLADIHLKKFNYKKIFHKERMAKFNKEEAVIKNL